MLDNPTPDERRLLGAFRYCRNVAVLHSDDRLMPRRRAVWASWNHIGGNSDEEARDCPTVTYWMNSLQRIPHDTPLFVTLNPKREPRRDIAPRDLRSSAVRFGGDHGAAPALVAARPPQHLVLRRLFRRRLPRGRPAGRPRRRRVAWPVRRPWTVANESGRITLDRRDTARQRGSLSHEPALDPLCRYGDAPPRAAARASVALSRVLDAARPRRDRGAAAAACACSRTTASTP